MAAAMRKRTKKSARKGRKGGSVMRKTTGSGLEARVAKLEKNQKVIVGVLQVHQKALVTGGLLEARAKKVPALGGGRRKGK